MRRAGSISTRRNSRRTCALRAEPDGCRRCGAFDGALVHDTSRSPRRWPSAIPTGRSGLAIRRAGAGAQHHRRDACGLRPAAQRMPDVSAPRLCGFLPCPTRCAATSPASKRCGTMPALAVRVALRRLLDRRCLLRAGGGTDHRAMTCRSGWRRRPMWPRRWSTSLPALAGRRTGGNVGPCLLRSRPDPIGPARPRPYRSRRDGPCAGQPGCPSPVIRSRRTVSPRSTGSSSASATRSAATRSSPMPRPAGRAGAARPVLERGD